MRAIDSTNLYISVLDKVKDAIVVINRNGDILFYNKTAESMIGLSQKLYKNELIELLELLKPDGKTKIEKNNHPVFKISRDEKVVNEEFILALKKKSPKPIIINMHPLLTDGVKKGTLIIIQDITAQKETEKKLNNRSKSLIEAYEGLRRAEVGLKTTNTELEKRVLERTQHLTRINKELQNEIQIRLKTEQKIKQSNAQLIKINNDLDNFIYTASHDLKAPISNIEGLIYALKDEASYNHENPIAKQLMDMICVSVDKFKLTISDLTEISKIQKGGDDLIEELKFEDILKDTEQSVGELIRTTQTKIEYNFQECPSIKLSRKNLKSIFYNLLSNAIKYRRQGISPLIKITTETDLNYCVFKISDNGMGIPEGKKIQIFSMFKRLHDHVEGSGIGLYIVKRIVENSGGEIEVESILGKGTEFTIYFPLN